MQHSPYLPEAPNEVLIIADEKMNCISLNEEMRYIFIICLYMNECIKYKPKHNLKFKWIWKVEISIAPKSKPWIATSPKYAKSPVPHPLPKPISSPTKNSMHSSPSKINKFSLSPREATSSTSHLINKSPESSPLSKASWFSSLSKHNPNYNKFSSIRRTKTSWTSKNLKPLANTAMQR